MAKIDKMKSFKMCTLLIDILTARFIKFYILNSCVNIDEAVEYGSSLSWNSVVNKAQSLFSKLLFANCATLFNSNEKQKTWLLMD